jgi:hypothetical protein
MEDKIIEKRCAYCGGELWPVNKLFKLQGEETYQTFKDNFKKETGLDWKESPNANCTSCGMIYNELLMPTGACVEWIGQLIEGYKSYKEKEKI